MARTNGVAGPERTSQRDWGGLVTPQSGRNAARHRWYLFPHSFAAQLIQHLVDEWALGCEDRILDPFVGSGTTLLAGMQAGVSVYGYDLSPLAVFASRTKAMSFDRDSLKDAWERLKEQIARRGKEYTGREYAALVHRALPDGRLAAFDSIFRDIDKLRCHPEERDFFRLGLLAILPAFSHAVGNGGWLRWTNAGKTAKKIEQVYHERIDSMLLDIGIDEKNDGKKTSWGVALADARQMPCADSTYTAVITSPPYPNRHDYTRIFGVELLVAFQDAEANRALRYQMFHSHPEARPTRPMDVNYQAPGSLGESMKHVHDKRLRRMIDGYFLDMYLCLKEIRRVCRTGGRAALVVGNAQYGGVPLEVDELTAEVGEQAGLRCTEIRTVRVRGNSAQQMATFGRKEARESVVFFENL